MDITSDQVRDAARHATTLTEVARQLGIKETKLSGRTAKKLRALCPELDEILKANRISSPKPSPKQSGKVFQNQTPESPLFRAGSLYAVLHEEGSKKFWHRTELVSHVAKLMGTEERLVSFQLCVLSRPGHSSNGNRSTALTDDKGRIRLARCTGERFRRRRSPARGN